MKGKPEYLTIDGITKRITQWADENKQQRNTVHTRLYRIRQGGEMTLRQAVGIDKIPKKPKKKPVKKVIQVVKKEKFEGNDYMQEFSRRALCQN